MTKESRTILLDAAVRQLEAAVDMLRVALAEDIGATAPAEGCPHTERIDMRTAGNGPAREMCKACGAQFEAGVMLKGAA